MVGGIAARWNVGYGHYFLITYLPEVLPPHLEETSKIAVELNHSFVSNAAASSLLADLLTAAAAPFAAQYQPRNLIAAINDRPRIARMLAGLKRFSAFPQLPTACRPLSLAIFLKHHSMNFQSQPVRIRLFDPATGKANFQLRYIGSGQIKLNNGLLHVTSKEEIEKCDLSRFLIAFNPRNPRKQLQQMRNKVMFTVAGYDNHPEPLFAIPEVRRYFTKCHQSWPCWLPLAELHSDCLAMIACCVIPNLNAIQRANHKVAMALRQSDLASFFDQGLPATGVMHARLGIDTTRGKRMLRRVLKYLDLDNSE